MVLSLGWQVAVSRSGNNCKIYVLLARGAIFENDVQTFFSSLADCNCNCCGQWRLATAYSMSALEYLARVPRRGRIEKALSPLKPYLQILVSPSSMAKLPRLFGSAFLDTADMTVVRNALTALFVLTLTSVTTAAAARHSAEVWWDSTNGRFAFANGTSPSTSVLATGVFTDNITTTG